MRKRDESKNEAIFAATLKLVLEKGLTGMNMCDISKAAGIATGTIYIYFDSKETLVNELFTVCRKESAEFYFTDVNPNDSFEKKFRDIFFNIVRFRQLYFEKYIFLEQSFHSPFISERAKEASRIALEPIFNLLRQGKEQGIIREIDDWLLLSFLVGAINEMVKKAHYDNKDICSHSVENLYKLCYSGIKA